MLQNFSGMLRTIYLPHKSAGQPWPGPDSADLGGLAYAPAVSCRLAKQLCWSWLGLPTGLRFGWLSVELGCPQLGWFHHLDSFPGLSLLVGWPTYVLHVTMCREAKAKQTQLHSTLQAYTCIILSNIPLSKARPNGPRIRMGKKNQVMWQRGRVQ